MRRCTPSTMGGCVITASPRRRASFLGARFHQVFGAYRVMPGLWRDYGDGKLVYDSLTEKNKEVLALLNGWYSDGLMDPDIHTLDWLAD